MLSWEKVRDGCAHWLEMNNEEPQIYIILLCSPLLELACHQDGSFKGRVTNEMSNMVIFIDFKVFLGLIFFSATGQKYFPIFP